MSLDLHRNPLSPYRLNSAYTLRAHIFDNLCERIYTELFRQFTRGI